MPVKLAFAQELQHDSVRSFWSIILRGVETGQKLQIKPEMKIISDDIGDQCYLCLHSFFAAERKFNEENALPNTASTVKKYAYSVSEYFLNLPENLQWAFATLRSLRLR